MVWLACEVLALVISSGAPARAQSYPEAVVSAFCERDGRGDRLRNARWRNIAPLVTWRLEPAWDRAYLISGYEVSGAKVADNGVDVRVKYSVVAAVSAAGVKQAEHMEIITVHLVGAPGAWRIAGPPPWPHLFDSMVDRKAMVASLQPEGGSFVTNSTFIWQMFRGAQWALSYRPVEEYLTEPGLALVALPQSGDVVVYMEGETAYHAALYEGGGMIVSATVNAGTVRTGLNAFAGEVRYLRLSDVERIAPTPGRTAPRAKPTAGPPHSSRRAHKHHTAARPRKRPTPKRHG